VSTVEHWTALPSTQEIGLVAVLALGIGLLAAWVYFARDLTLSHYDAKAHLVVARRILDSLRPGWMQIGAVWLPLPHLLNLLPVQVDWLYRTGLSGVAISVTSFVLATTSLWWLVARAGGSRAAAWAAFAVVAAQPDVLYLQATPMTEPLLMGLCLLGVALTWRWLAAGASGHPSQAGLALALACLTRYEAWPITAGILVLTGVALLRTGGRTLFAFERVLVLAVYPTFAVLAFLLLSRATVGRWFVADGFFRVDPATYHRPAVALGQVAYGVVTLNGFITTAFGAAACVVLLKSIRRSPEDSPRLVGFALLGCALLPLCAFWSGHPFRIRYMVPMTMGLAAVTGLGIACLPRRRKATAMVVALVALIETPPLSSSPMVREAQWDTARAAQRRQVTTCLIRDYDGTPILASMGALAHYMQETSRVGLPLKAFIHEGLGDLWSDSLVAARRHAGWVLIAEQNTTRDPLARLYRTSPSFLEGFTRVCTGGGVALYRLARD
jgi:hypothetical protein